MSFVFLILQKSWQSGEASRWRVCYQRGLPRLVYPDGATKPKRLNVTQPTIKYNPYILMELQLKGSAPVACASGFPPPLFFFFNIISSYYVLSSICRPGKSQGLIYTNLTHSLIK